ncbi:hypothetical protein L1D29_15650, partial [Shewanella insulae]|uniref:hypothetical protein n=1 Tax=Shewanella insulae TaxID=2681496 RepID=UPI001EFD690F
IFVFGINKLIFITSKAIICWYDFLNSHFEQCPALGRISVATLVNCNLINGKPYVYTANPS